MMPEKKFTLCSLGREYNIISHEEATLDAVWASQKCWFSEGTKVLISDGTSSKVYEKAREEGSEMEAPLRLAIPLGDFKIIATASEGGSGFPPEISVFIEDEDGCISQDLCVVRPHIELETSDRYLVDDSKVDVLVWNDPCAESYTFANQIPVYKESD